MPRSIQLSYGRTGSEPSRSEGSAHADAGEFRCRRRPAHPADERRARRLLDRARPSAGLRRLLPPASRARSRRASRRRSKRGTACSTRRSTAASRSTSPPSDAQGDWRIEIPAWVRDQRNQMTGPADDHELGVKMLNSGAPGVMIDLEDSMANDFAHTLARHRQHDRDVLRRADVRRREARRQRRRHQAVADGAVDARARSAPLASRHLRRADVRVAVRSRAARVQARLLQAEASARDLHPEVASRPSEALWWRDVFQAVAQAKGLDKHAIKAMALVEAFPFAYQIEEFAYTSARPSARAQPRALGLHGLADPLQPRRPELGAAGPQHDPARRRLLPEPARAHPRSVPPPRPARDRRHDGAVSRPLESRAQRARARRAGDKTRRTSPTRCSTARGPGTRIRTRSPSRSSRSRIKASRASPARTRRRICCRRSPASARRRRPARAPRCAR